jgi:hypothetical protein
MYALNTTLERLTQRSLDEILDIIPVEGISEIEIASTTGFEFEDIKERLQVLKQQGLVKSDGDGTWFRTKTQLTVVPKGKAIAVDVDFEDAKLSDSEKEDLTTLEGQVRSSFYLAGKALQEICLRRLYRERFKTFEDYCKQKLGIDARSVYLQISAAKTYETLKCDPLVRILPINERQVRPLSELQEEDQVTVWQKAVTENNNRVPSGTKVDAITKKFKQNQDKSSNPHNVGAIVSPGRGWWVVIEAREFSCVCRNWCEEKIFHHSEIKPYLGDLSEDQQKSIKGLQEELWSLWEISEEMGKRGDRLVARQLITAIANNLECGQLTDFQESVLTSLRVLVEGYSD